MDDWNDLIMNICFMALTIALSADLIVICAALTVRAWRYLV